MPKFFRLEQCESVTGCFLQHFTLTVSEGIWTKVQSSVFYTVKMCDKWIYTRLKM